MDRYTKSSTDDLLDIKSDENDSRLLQSLKTQAIRYYEGFKWVAEVEVLGCNSETSVERAQFAVAGAVDVLHLILGANFSSNMRMGGPRLKKDQRARITRDRDGLVEIFVSRAPIGQVLEQNWWEIISAGDGAHYLEAAGEALEVTTDPDLKRPLCYRFLEALSWFGQAVRETSDAARVVKYITSIEQMILTDKKNPTKTVRSRGAALCWDPDGNLEMHQWFQEIARLYDLRSMLVHGEVSPFDAQVAAEVRNCERVARRVLFSGLSFFHAIGLNIGNISSNQLRRLYSNHMQAVHKLAKHTCE